MKIHFIGIGGIGVSGLANLYLEKGCFVSGSDKEASEITEPLKKKGAKVFIGHKQSNIARDVDLVIYSEAVPENNPELKKAKSLGIKTLSGAQAVAEFTRDYFLIAVSGMHGKTTTASMAAKLLVDVGLDPTYIIGTKNGFRLGKSKYLIIEADDYKAKLLNYHPDILLLTNIEEEHMDCFKDLEHILKVFKQYIGQVKQVIIANQKDSNIKKVIASAKCKKILYSKVNFRLAVPGAHNQENAAAVMELAKALKVDLKKAESSLKNYQGTWRRLEEKQLAIGSMPLAVVSDYAHHPTEIKASVQAIKEKYPKKKILLVFQPHQYQRTFYLFDRFIEAFKTLSPVLKQVIITDIYTVKGRESAILKKKVSAQKLVKAINKVNINYLPEKELLSFIKGNIKGFDVLVIMTAGNIYKIVENISPSS
ncbi:MAG: Mur ligase domain-containing protein [bacterium]|nr:Mur ligase domain-containing protein [bacterium]